MVTEFTNDAEFTKFIFANKYDLKVNMNAITNVITF